MEAFEKFKKLIGGERSFPTELFVKCPDCQAMNVRKDVEERKMVCPQCGCPFTLSVPERLALMLTAAFTGIGSAAISSELRSDHLLKPEDTFIEIDIAPILTMWTTTPGTNYGVLFKSTSTGTSPAQVVFAPPDSVVISYTTIPEVR